MTDVILEDGDVIGEHGDVSLESRASSSSSSESQSISSSSFSSESSSSQSAVLGSLSSISSSSESSSSLSSSSSSLLSSSSESSSSQSALSGSKSSISSESSLSSSKSVSSTFSSESSYSVPSWVGKISGSSSSVSSESSISSSMSKRGIPLFGARAETGVVDAAGVGVRVGIHMPNVGDLVTLWELHLTSLGGSIYRFVGDTSESGGIGVAVTFDGETYYPRSFQADGFGHTGRGQQPRPRIKIADVDNTIHDLNLAYQDMLGAIVKRIRTFRRYLDDGANPDPTAQLPIDVYIIAKKVTQTKVFIEYELNPYMDKEGKNIPARLVLKDTCSFIYRRWNGSSFDYNTDRPCPYASSRYYRRDGTSTTDAAEDICPHTLAGCKARYGDYGPMPFGGCPGINRLRR